MGFLSNLKGYFRRASTPKKDTTYIPEETTFGNIEVRYTHSIVLNKNLSNIILEISFSKNNENAIESYNKFSDMISEVGLIKTKYDIPEKLFIYIGGSVASYKLLLDKYFFKEENAYDKILRKVYNILKEIDIMNNDQDKVYPYTTEYQTIKEVNPVYVENIDTSFLSPEVVDDKDKDIFDYLINVLIIGLYDDYCETITDTITRFISSYNNNVYYDDLHQLIEQYKDTFYSNFEIYGYKNIFDINFRVTNSTYDDTEEIIG